MPNTDAMTVLTKWLFCPVGGWAIPSNSLQKESLIGKGKFKGI